MRPEPLALLGSIISAPSPSGSEHPVAKLYREYTGRFADQVSTDVHGNVVAVLNPDASMKIMLAGHMDEIGFIIPYISDEGLLHFSPIGGHDGVVPVGQTVWVHGTQRVTGVVGRRGSTFSSRTSSRRSRR